MCSTKQFNTPCTTIPNIRGLYNCHRLSQISVNAHVRNVAERVWVYLLNAGIILDDMVIIVRHCHMLIATK